MLVLVIVIIPILILPPLLLVVTYGHDYGNKTDMAQDCTKLRRKYIEHRFVSTLGGEAMLQLRPVTAPGSERWPVMVCCQTSTTVVVRCLHVLGICRFDQQMSCMERK